MSADIRLPADARFTCQSCGRCCQGWAVPVDAATVDALRRHNWGGEPFEASRTAGEPYRIRLVNNRCFFLDAQNRCRIHSEISYEAKPAVCRSFPLAVLDINGRQYARLSFWCPTVTANAGRPLAQQARWIKDTARHADRRTAPVTIQGTATIDHAQVDRIHQALKSLVESASAPLEDRLAAGAELIHHLDVSGVQKASTQQTIDRVLESGIPALSRAARSRGDRSGGRRVLTLYLVQDRGESRFAVVTRAVAVQLFFAGILRLRSGAVQASASWRKVRKVAFVLSDHGDELLTRYFCSKIDSRRCIAGDATLVTGFNLLLAAYAVINLLARMRAASNGRDRTNDEDLRAAVSAADLIVVEHPSLNEGEVHRRLVTAALGSSSLCGGLLAALSPRVASVPQSANEIRG